MKPRSESVCWLARFAPAVPCDGRLVRAHLLPKRELKRLWAARNHGTRFDRQAAPDLSSWRDRDALVWDERVWVPACGGPMGNAGHHGMLDHARTLRVPRVALPAELEVVAEQLGLVWWLDREYGVLGDVAA